MKRAIVLVIALGVLSMGVPGLASAIPQEVSALFDKMRDEADIANYSHEGLRDMKFIRCYYVQRSGIPHEELGKGLYKVENGRMVDFSRDMWLDQALRSVMGSEIVINVDLVKWILSDSEKFLIENKGFYSNHSFAAELAYLKNGMRQWQNNIAVYHNALDEFFALASDYKKYYRYEQEILGGRKLAGLEKQYAGKDKDDAYWKERKAIENWIQEQYQLSENASNRIGNGGDVRVKVEGAKSVKVPFDSLRNEFETKVELMKQNDLYMKYTERLKQVDSKSEEAKAIRDALPGVVETLQAMASREQEKYGPGWKDRYREGKTGALPGGYLRDRGLEALKVAFNKKANKLVFPVGRPKKADQLPVQDRLLAFLKACADEPARGVSSEQVCPGCGEEAKTEGPAAGCEKAKEHFTREARRIMGIVSVNISRIQKDNYRLIALMNGYLLDGKTIQLKWPSREMSEGEKASWYEGESRLKEILRSQTLNEEGEVFEGRERGEHSRFGYLFRKASLQLYGLQVSIDKQGYDGKRDALHQDLIDATMLIDKALGELTNQHALFKVEIKGGPGKDLADAQYRDVVRRIGAMRAALDEYNARILEFQKICDQAVERLSLKAQDLEASPSFNETLEGEIYTGMSDLMKDLYEKGHPAIKAFRQSLDKFSEEYNDYKDRMLPEILNACDGSAAGRETKE